MPVGNVGALVRTASKPNRVQSCPVAAARDPRTATAAASRLTATLPRATLTGRSLPSALQEHAAELVFLAGLENRQHLVARLELGRADGDLRLPVAHHRDEPRSLGKLEALDTLAGDRRVAVDLHLDDLEVLLAQLEEVDQVVLRDLVLDERHDARRRADRRRDAEQVEMRLVARVVHARDHLRHAVLLLGELADDHVVLVVAREREQDLRRPRDPGALEDKELGRVTAVHLVLELLLEALEAVAALLDQR